MSELCGLSYSPWTQKARWALEHHRISFRYVEHMPMLGEARLRWKLQRPTGRVTVPILVTRHGTLMDSLVIAEFAERVGKGTPLFPEGKRSEIGAWNDASERALAAGRGLVVARTARSEGAKAEALPSFVPGLLRPAMTGLASAGIAFFRWKYGLDGAGEDQRRAAIADELRGLRGALGGRPYLLDGFSYADITMSMVLQLVRPASDEHWKLRPATREVWRDPALESEFGDLAEWRDGLFAKHRQLPIASS